MKKTLLTLFALTLTIIVNAQNEFGIQLNGGLSKFAPNFLGENDVIDAKAKFSYLVGLYYETSLNEKLDLGFGLNFNKTESTETSNWTADNRTYSEQYTKKMSNIGIPVYLELNTTKKLYFDIGLRFSINTSSYLHYIYIDNNMILNERDWDDMNLKKLQFGGQAGVGYQINDNIGVFTQYYRDLIDLPNSEGDATFKSWQWHLGLKYALKK